MPGKLKAKIVAGRHLPVMDRASDLTDAFVEVSDCAQNSFCIENVIAVCWVLKEVVLQLSYGLYSSVSALCLKIFWAASSQLHTC